MLWRYRLNDVLGGTVERCPYRQRSAGERVCTKPCAVNPVPYNLRRRKRGRGKSLPKPKAGLAEFHAAEAKVADAELSTDEVVEANAARDDVSAGAAEVCRLIMRCGKGFDLFGFNECDVLPWLVTRVVVAVAFDSRSCADKHGLVLRGWAA